MNISSVVIRSHPSRCAEVRAHLGRLPGVEVHAESADGKLVVTLEDSDVCTAADTYVALHDIPGVLLATLIYQYGADDLPAAATDESFKASKEEA